MLDIEPVKKSLTPEEMGWKVLPAGNFDDWDGMVNWFVGYVSRNPALKKNSYINRWYSACKNLNLS